MFVKEFVDEMAPSAASTQIDKKRDYYFKDTQSLSSGKTYGNPNS